MKIRVIHMVRVFLFLGERSNETMCFFFFMDGINNVVIHAETNYIFEMNGKTWGENLSTRYLLGLIYDEHDCIFVL